jgi:hypothetical protein
MKQARKRLTYANVMSSLAVFLVLGGGAAFAASKLAKNSVGSTQLKRNAVTAAKLKRNAVTEAKIANSAVTGAKIRAGAVTGAKIDLATLGAVPSAKSLTGYARKGFVRVDTSPEAGDVEATRAASPEVPLVSVGPFTVYGKCFLLNGGTNGQIFVRTTENGSILDSGVAAHDGSLGFLDQSTPEAGRRIVDESAGPNEAGYKGVHVTEFAAMAPSGTAIRGDAQVAVKQGNLPAGNGIYGPGDVCLFAAQATAFGG